MFRKRKTVLDRNLSETPWRTFGIVGAGHAVGTTHLTVWTANWLAAVLGERVAVLEWNDHGDFERMKSFCGKTDCTGGFWRLLGVDYFPRAGRQELAACINGAYHRILIDYGVWNTDSRAECTRCERKALVGSLTEWQAGTFLDLIRSETWKQEEARGVARSREWELFTAFGSEETRRSVEKEFKMAVRRIPFSTDAFVITGVDLQFFQFGIY